MFRITSTKSFGAMSIAALMTVTSAQAAVLETQTFDTEAAATAAGWTQVGTSSAYSNTDFTGGTSPAGEAGGALNAVSATRDYYADTTLGGTIALTEDLQASGEFRLRQSSNNAESGFVGFFDTTATNFGNSVGFILLDGGATDSRIRASARLDDGTQVLGGTSFVAHNVDLTFTINWDAATRGLQYQVFNGVTLIATDTLVLSVGEVAGFDSIDAFGIGTGSDASGNLGTTVEAYIDNLEYTNVPEPASLALVMVGGVLMAGRNKQH